MTNVLSCPKAGKIGPIRREIIFEPLPDDTVPDEPAPVTPEQAGTWAGAGSDMTDLSARPGTDEADPAFVAGTFRGYRAWRAISRWIRIPEGLVASGLGHATTGHLDFDLDTRCTPPESWSSRCPPPEVADGHTSPSMQCTCGIYAWYAPDDAGMLSARVFGVVEASGLVLMGDSGFRAERARIVAMATRNGRVASACAAAGIAVYRRRRDLLEDYPRDDLTSLLGEQRPPRRARLPTPPLPRLRQQHAVLHAVGCGATAFFVGRAAADATSELNLARSEVDTFTTSRRRLLHVRDCAGCGWSLVRVEDVVIDVGPSVPCCP